MRCFFLVLVVGAGARVLDIDTYGAKRADASEPAVLANVAALNRAIADAVAGDEVLVSKGAGAYSVRGPIVADHVANVTIRFEGDVTLDDDIAKWAPFSKKAPWFRLVNSSHVTLTGSGTIDGQGMRWWDASVTGSTKGLGEKRPNLFDIQYSTDLIIEHLRLLNSPHFHLCFKQCARVTVRFVTISVDRWAQRRLKARAHTARLVPWLNASLASAVVRWIYRLDEMEAAAGTVATPPRPSAVNGRPFIDWLLDEAVRLLPSWLLQPEDLNTDGIDPNGEGFHIHDCRIDNDDDSIAVKPAHGTDGLPCTRDLLLENLVLTGFGASIGSVPPHADGACVRNVTFRNISMPGTGKGVYIKSNPSCGLALDRHGQRVPKTAVIADILYEGVTMTKPWWWAIWIGPQQQHEPGSALGDKCSLSYPVAPHCPTQGCVTFSNITLRNVLIDDPMLSPGVILGNASNPMRGVVLDNVRVRFSQTEKWRGSFPWGRKFLCEHGHVDSRGGTEPAPACGSELLVE